MYPEHPLPCRCNKLHLRTQPMSPHKPPPLNRWVRCKSFLRQALNRTQKQYLNPAARGLPEEKPRRNDLRHIPDQKRPRRKQPRKLCKDVMPDFFPLTIRHQQAALVSLRQWVLSNSLAGKLVRILVNRNRHSQFHFLKRRSAPLLRTLATEQALYFYTSAVERFAGR